VSELLAEALGRFLLALGDLAAVDHYVGVPRDAVDLD
jgi:hypothetical protein